MNSNIKNTIKSFLNIDQLLAIRKIKSLSWLIYQDIKVNFCGKFLTLKPTTLNLLVNDVCNSHCQMCSIWKMKRDKEFTPKELERILSNTLFENLQSVGVSGGEPTLREDLPDIYRVLVNNLPQIKGTGIITNAIQKKDVINKIMASGDVCHKAGVPFNVMVSLDGIGVIHDRIRGRDGNFKNALGVIRYFRDKTNIPISIGCTITKDNVWHVDEVLDFCRDEGVQGRFRVGEFIRRLYNNDQTDCIRNFSEKEAYHLGLFFAKLEHAYETSPKVKRTYRSIRKMLMNNAERSIKCPWQAIAVTLDCRGRILYCAPRSPTLGDCLKDSPMQIYKRHTKKRSMIINHDCGKCIHDYHADETVCEWLSQRKVDFWRWHLSLKKSLHRSKQKKDPASLKLSFSKKHEPSRVLVIGWYGTETAGDKAILGEIIHRIHKNHHKSHIILASLHPYLSRWTIRELGYTGIEVISTYSRDFWRYTKKADEVVMGGGPLMHMEQLGIVLSAFVRAKEAGNRTRIMGCGIGPLDRGRRYQEAVKQIMYFADLIELRDSASVAWAIRATSREDIINSGDPAIGYIRRWMERHSIPEKTSSLNLYLRNWTTEYQGDLSYEQFSNIKERFEIQLGIWISEICKLFNLHPRLIPMHHFVIGNDDRDFNRSFARKYLSKLNPNIERTPLSLQEILASMQEATLSLCMRFHSVLFANVLAIPYLAIDYTQGGKIASYLRDHSVNQPMVPIIDIADGKWHNTLMDTKKMLITRNHIKG